MLPHQINEAIRLVLVAESSSAELLDDPARFDSVLGRGSFAELDGEALGIARRIIKSRADGGEVGAVDFSQVSADANDQKLD